jgi:cell division protein FtsB
MTPDEALAYAATLRPGELTEGSESEVVATLADEVERLRAEVDKLDGHRAVLAERCYRKDLELDELRPRRWPDPDARATGT